MSNKFAKNVCSFNPSDLATIKNDEPIKNYTALLDEVLGGVTVYVHKSIAEQFTTFLVWIKPQTNSDMDFNDEDWDGWLSRGWDIMSHSNMEENLRNNGALDDTIYDIVINDVVVAKTTFESHVEPYTAFFNDFLAYHAKI